MEISKPLCNLNDIFNISRFKVFIWISAFKQFLSCCSCYIYDCLLISHLSTWITAAQPGSPKLCIALAYTELRKKKSPKQLKKYLKCKNISLLLYLMEHKENGHISGLGNLSINSAKCLWLTFIVLLSFTDLN